MAQVTIAPAGPALWAPFVDALPVDGGSVSLLLAPGGIGSTISTSDDLAERLDAMHADLGEGPRWQAFRSGAPVLVPDVRFAGAHDAWPLFGVAVRDTAAQALFSFPMILGLAVVGVADLYSRTPCAEWSAGLVADASALAAATAGPAVLLATASAEGDGDGIPADAPELRREVHQATGMLIVHLGVTPAEALARLEARAFRTGVPLAQVARDVVERRLDFRDGSE